MNDIVKKLKDNFLFHASLGSKELFHSNLLAWILEQRNSKGEFEALRIFIKTVAKLDVGIITDDNNPIIAREENKIDLTIKWKEGNDWNLIFIENKMKSIPTLEQLKEYDKKTDKLQDTTTKDGLKRKVLGKILLTPFDSIIKPSETKIPWQNITYVEHVISFLQIIKDFEYANSKQTNIKLVIEKYISFLSAQNEIVRFLNLDDLKKFQNRCYDFYSKHAVENEDESEEIVEENEEIEKHYMSIIRSLRLNDLVLKIAHSKIANLVDDEIKNHRNLLENYHHHSNFTNSKGITDVGTRIYEDVSKKKHINIGIQLQGNQFRYYLSSSSDIKDLNIKLAEELLKEGIWFYNVITNKELLGSGRSKRKVNDREGKERVFCEYSSGGFLYFYQDVYENDQIPSVENIIEMFISVFEYYETNKSKILGILKDTLKIKKLN